MMRIRYTSLLLAASLTACTSTRSDHQPVQFSISIPASLRSDPFTGRIYLVIARDSAPEPRFTAGSFTRSVPFFGIDVDSLPAGKTVVLSDTVLGYPVRSIRDLAPGDYYVQAIGNVYTPFHHADGHTIWAHMDQWEGQHFATSPGNLVSAVQRVHIDPATGYNLSIAMTKVLPPVDVPPDTKWVKHIRIQSDLLTKFWGHPMYLGATVLLPAGYDSHPHTSYPVIYDQGHFSLRAPLGFTPDSTPVPAAQRARLAGYNRETGYDFYRAWTGQDFPRLIAVAFQHPTPYFDDSYAVNSANNGPYGDAIMQELIPYVETHFRIIRKPYARVLTGGSTGGWESLALQVYHADFFGGTWTLYPDPVDFQHYGVPNAYTDSNAFVVDDQGPLSPVSEWFHPERPQMRGNDGQTLVTLRQMSQLEAVLGTRGRSGEQLEAWDAVYGPVGPDGYPVPLWDKHTGHINHDVASYMRDHGYDLTAYLRQHWAHVGPQLVDKLHIDVGDMDNFYLNLAVYDLQAFLDSTRAPHVTAVFNYGRPEKGHGWQHTSTANIVREMAASIARHAGGERTVAGTASSADR